MTISARLVRKPRKVYHCNGCYQRIIGPHVYAYGHAEDHAPPFGIRLHIECCGTDAKMNAAIQSACRIADAQEVAA